MIDNYLPRIHVHFAALVIIVGGVSLPPDVVAAYVIFTNEAEFRLASGPVGLETFNSQINDTPFHTTRFSPKFLNHRFVDADDDSSMPSDQAAHDGATWTRRWG